MRLRWTLAVLASIALAWTTIAAEMPWLIEGAFAPAMTSCPADAKPATDFTLKDVNNRDVKLSSFRGKVVLLDFWATWCGPCKLEIPWFLEFQQKFGKDGLQVIGVSVDDTLAKMKPYVAEMKMTYPVLQGLNRDDLVDAYGATVALPTTVMISRDGKVCSRHIGLTGKDVFEAEIAMLLKAKSS